MPQLVTAARELFETPVMRLMLEAMESENPVRKVAPPDITPHGAFIMLGEQTGWNQFKDRFLLCSAPIETPDSIGEQDYAVPADEAVEKES